MRSLSVTPITSGPSHRAVTAYIALIANRGLTGAGPVEVDFADAGRRAGGRRRSRRSEPKSTARQRFVAPACTPGSTLTVTVDPTQSIDEYDYANNVLTMTCPAASSG